MVKNLSLLFLILLMVGCSASKKINIPAPMDAKIVVTGSVVNASAFAKGGTLDLGSFEPGPGAAADDETDRLSAMLIKGINDAWPGENTRFSILADGQKDPAYGLEGYIENYTKKGHVSRLSIDGEIASHDTGEKIFLFQSATVIDLKDQDPKTVAYRIGEAVSHFIGAQANGGNP